MKKVRYLSSKLNAFVSPLSFASLSSSPVGGANVARRCVVVGGQSRARYRSCGAHPSLSPRERWIARRARRRGDEKPSLNCRGSGTGRVRAKAITDHPRANSVQAGACRGGDEKSYRYCSGIVRRGIPSQLRFAQQLPRGGSQCRTKVRGCRRAEPCPVSFLQSAS